MRLGLKIEARSSAPSPNLHIVVRTVPVGTEECGRLE